MGLGPGAGLLDQRACASPVRRPQARCRRPMCTARKAEGRRKRLRLLVTRSEWSPSSEHPAERRSGTPERSYDDAGGFLREGPALQGCQGRRRTPLSCWTGGSAPATGAPTAATVTRSGPWRHLSTIRAPALRDSLEGVPHGAVRPVAAASLDHDQRRAGTYRCPDPRTPRAGSWLRRRHPGDLPRVDPPCALGTQARHVRPRRFYRRVEERIHHGALAERHRTRLLREGPCLTDRSVGL
ncbi:hypothetical protein M2156_008802 [Streptomyces sp. SAI-149]|nr:hypothetical protein [Streptomyces sp. SAI-149]